MYWYGGSIAEAVTLSKQKNAIFVVFVEGDNELSTEMASTIDDAAVLTRLSNQSQFLAIKLKSGSPNYTHFAQIYQFVPVPSLFFIGRNGTPLEVVCAGVQPENLATRIDRILEEHYKDKPPMQPSTSAQNVREQTLNFLEGESASPAKTETAAPIKLTETLVAKESSQKTEETDKAQKPAEEISKEETPTTSSVILNIPKKDDINEFPVFKTINIVDIKTIEPSSKPSDTLDHSTTESIISKEVATVYHEGTYLLPKVSGNTNLDKSKSNSGMEQPTDFVNVINQRRSYVSNTPSFSNTPIIISEIKVTNQKNNFEVTELSIDTNELSGKESIDINQKLLIGTKDSKEIVSYRIKKQSETLTDTNEDSNNENVEKDVINLKKSITFKDVLVIAKGPNSDGKEHILFKSEVDLRDMNRDRFESDIPKDPALRRKKIIVKEIPILPKDEVLKSNEIVLKDEQEAVPPPAKVVKKNPDAEEYVCDGDVCVRKPNKPDEPGPSQIQAVSAPAPVETLGARESAGSIEEKLDRAKELIEARRREKAEKEKEQEKEKERERRTTGKGVAELKRWQAEQELKQIQEERRREKQEDNLARQRVLQQIARDRAERRARDAPAHPPAHQPAPQVPVQSLSGDGGNRARVQFKLPDGTSHTAHFDADGTLGDVQTYVTNNLQLPTASFSLWTAFPRRELTECTANLRSLGLAPSAALLVLPRSIDTVTPAPSYARVLTLLTHLFTTLILEPTQQLFNWIRARMFPPPAISRGNTPGPTNREPSPLGVRLRGNIHRLPSDRGNDDDNNTWNGNSTQQM